MPVIFLQWRAEVLQRVRRLISILSSQEGEHVEDQETALTWFFFSVELKCLQELADTPPDALQSDAMIGLLRLRRLCETWSVVRDEIKNVSDYSATLISFLGDQASPTGITRLKKIVNLLANAEPWDAGDSTCTEGIGHAAAVASQGGSNRLFPRSITPHRSGSERSTRPESGDRARAFAQA